MAHGVAMQSTVPALSKRVTNVESSAIRDLLAQAKRPGMISLAGGLPDAASFPRAELAAIAHRVIEGDSSVLQYGQTAGDDEARAALTALFGAATTADDLVITTGSQQALDLIARAMINRGDQVVAGDPDYLGALQVFRSYGADLRPIAVDSDGLNTERLEEQLRWGMRPTCAYVVPNFHNPSGASMSLNRRTHLYDLADRYGFLVIEDDPYRELYYDAAPAYDEVDSANVVQLRSLSKTLAPGLRIGAMAGPTWLLDAVTTAKQSVDLHTSTLSQAIAAEAINAPWYPGHLDDLRSAYRTKRDTLVSALRAEFGERITFDVPRGGMFLWAQFEHISNTSAWLPSCLERGVCFVPGDAFAVTRDLSSYARFSFSTGSNAELEEAAGRLS